MNLRRFLFRKSTIGVAVAGVAVLWIGLLAFPLYSVNPKRWVKLRAIIVAEKYISTRSTEKVTDNDLNRVSAGGYTDEQRRKRPNARRLDYEWFIPWYLDAEKYSGVSIGNVYVFRNKTNPNKWRAVAYLSVARRWDGCSQYVDEIFMDIEVKPDRTVSEKVGGSFLGVTWSFKSYDIQGDHTRFEEPPGDRYISERGSFWDGILRYTKSLLP